MPRGQGQGSNFEFIIEFVKDGRRANEYFVEHHLAQSGKPSYMEAWIESEIGQEFRIILNCFDPRKCVGKREVMATVYIDGRREERVADRLMFLSNSKQHIVQSGNFEKNGRTHTYPLVFCEPDTVADLAHAQVGGENAKSVGSIIVELDYGSSHGDRGRAFPAPVMKDVGIMWEKHVKLGNIVKSGAAKKAKGGVAKKAQMHDNASIFTPDTEGWETFFYEFRINYAPLVVIEKHRDEVQQGAKSAMPPTPKSIAPTPQPTAPTPQPRASSSSQHPHSSVPPAESSQRKRARPSSVLSSASSGSSSSSSSDSEAGASGDTMGMMKFFEIYMASQQAEKAQKKKAKAAKKLKKEEKKRIKREAKAKRRESKKKQVVDLTGDTDDEAEGSGTALAGIGDDSMYTPVKAEPHA